MSGEVGGERCVSFEAITDALGPHPYCQRSVDRGKENAEWVLDAQVPKKGGVMRVLEAKTVQISLTRKKSDLLQ